VYIELVCFIGFFAGGKKKKKSKGKTIALGEFLTDPSTGSNYIKDPPKPSGSWADATEELDPSGIRTCSQYNSEFRVEL